MTDKELARQRVAQLFSELALGWTEKPVTYEELFPELFQRQFLLQFLQPNCTFVTFETFCGLADAIHAGVCALRSGKQTAAHIVDSETGATFAVRANGRFFQL